MQRQGVLEAQQNKDGTQSSDHLRVVLSFPGRFITAAIPAAMKPLAFVFLGVFASSVSATGWTGEKLRIREVRSFEAGAIKLRHTLWWQVARERRLDPYILYAVALVESAHSTGSHRVAPWPWALNKAGKPILPSTREEAHVLLSNTLAKGNRQIDVGLMQVNIHWNGHRVGKPEDLLDPVTNLQIGADLLAEAIQSVPHDLVLGIGRYHSWQDVRAAMTYGRKVLAVAREIRTLL